MAWLKMVNVLLIFQFLTEYSVHALTGLPEPFSKYPTVCQTFQTTGGGGRRARIRYRHHHKHSFGAKYNDTMHDQNGGETTADSDSGVYDQMLRIDAMDLSFDSSSDINSYRLGQCTLPRGHSHVYSGDDHFTLYATTVPTFIKRTSSSSTSEFRDIMGGASVNVLGLFGASAKVQVTESIKRSGKTMLIISKYVTKKGFVSRLNAQPNTGDQNTYCKKAARHYYISDIMIGAEDYTFVELEFDSEQRRKETEVNIKVKILFFSISKTIRDIKQSSSQNLKIKVIRVSSYPSKHKVICDVTKASDNFDVVKLLEDIEKQRDEMQQRIRDATAETTEFHVEYFLTPCPAWNTAAKKQNDPLATELDLSRILQQETELQNVKEIAERDITPQLRQEMENTGRWGRFQEFLNDVNSVISRYKQTRATFGQKPITQSMADQLMAIYGENNAPYHYKLKLNSLLVQSCRG